MKKQKVVVPGKKKSVWTRLGSQWQLYLMMAPAILAMLIFHYVPMYGVTIAFKEVNPGQTFFEGAWVGLANFKRLFSSDLFTTVFKNTLIISLVEHFLLWPLPIIFALLVHNASSNKVRKFSQTFSYLPHLLSTVVVVSIIDLLCNRETGIINIIIEKLGGESVFFLGNPN